MADDSQSTADRIELFAPGMVTVVFPKPRPRSVATGVVADAQPHAAPAPRTTRSVSVLSVVPPMVMVRSARAANAPRAASEPSEGFPETSVSSRFAAMGQSRQ